MVLGEWSLLRALRIQIHGIRMNNAEQVEMVRLAIYQSYFDKLCPAGVMSWYLTDPTECFNLYKQNKDIAAMLSTRTNGSVTASCIDHVRRQIPIVVGHQENVT